MITDQQFRQAAALLKRSAQPDAWDNFLGAVQAFTFTRIGELVDAPRDRLDEMQGQAKMAKKLLQIMQECDIVPRDDKP